MPPKLLRLWMDSNDFTLLKAFRARNTLAPDTWFSALNLARVHLDDPPDRFVPITLDDNEADRRRREAAFDESLDDDSGLGRDEDLE